MIKTALASASGTFELEVAGKTVQITAEMVKLTQTLPEHIIGAPFTDGLVYLDTETRRVSHHEGCYSYPGCRLVIFGCDPGRGDSHRPTRKHHHEDHSRYRGGRVPDDLGSYEGFRAAHTGDRTPNRSV